MVVVVVVVVVVVPVGGVLVVVRPAVAPSQGWPTLPRLLRSLNGAATGKKIYYYYYYSLIKLVNNIIN